MINRKIFAREFILNLQNQGHKLLKIYFPTFEEIMLDHYYQVCPQYAIMIDPEIIDSTRKYSRKYSIMLEGRATSKLKSPSPSKKMTEVKKC